jgi:hypothetical protein
MRRGYIWLLVVLTASTVVGHPATPDYRETGRLARGSVRFQLYRDYLIIVQGSIGPLSGLNFLLDTGSNTTVLSPQLARKLQLEATPTDVAVLGGSVSSRIATAPSLQFGPIQRDNVPVLIQDLSFLQDALPVRIDAIVGLDMLGQSTFVIDYVSHEVRFGPASMPDSIPLHIRNGLAFVDADINHTTVHLLVDSAAPSLIVFEQSPGIQTDPKVAASQPSPGKIGNFQRNHVRQLSLTLGQVDFGQESVFVVPNIRDAGHDFDGMMSPVALGFTRVAVDLNQRTLTFSRQP